MMIYRYLLALIFILREFSVVFFSDNFPPLIQLIKIIRDFFGHHFSERRNGTVLIAAS
jgi:hypothetical protein